MKYHYKLIALALAFAPLASVEAALAPFDKVSEGYTKLAVNDQKNPKGLFTLWKKDKDAQLLGELPKTSWGRTTLLL